MFEDIRKRGMSGLRKAGKFLLDKDEQYANAVGKGIDPHKQPFRGITSTVPLRGIFGQGNPDETRVEKLLGAGMDAGVFSANVASRYLLPAGGVTLAGKGLYDLTTQFGGKADQPEENTLSIP